MYNGEPLLYNSRPKNAAAGGAACRGGRRDGANCQATTYTHIYNCNLEYDIPLYSACELKHALGSACALTAFSCGHRDRGSDRTVLAHCVVHVAFHHAVIYTVVGTILYLQARGHGGLTGHRKAQSVHVSA